VKEENEKVRGERKVTKIENFKINTGKAYLRIRNTGAKRQQK
jgi:hypothetical protein